MNKAKVIAKGLNLRSGPISTAEILKVLKQDTEVLVLKENLGDWVKVNFGIYNGYVAARFLEEIKEPTQRVLSLAERTMNIALAQLGKQEVPHGSNWGPDVQKYLKSVGINFPASWCMAFVYWCVSEAAKEMSICHPLVKTGGVMRQWNEIDKEYKVKNPQKGDIFIMDFGKGLGHTGFVSSVANGRIYTIEGNSNDDGNREGYEVCRKPGGRPISSCKGFIRVI